MANREEKARMLNFVLDRLSSSCLYRVQSADPSLSSVRIKEIANAVDHPPRTIDVLLHADKMTVEGFAAKYNENACEGVYTANIFLKDGETFFVRLAERGHYKREKSLKHLDKQKRDSTIQLRDLEKIVLKMTKTELAYYQPETERLPEGIRTYAMNNVVLDYSHLQRGDLGYGYAQNTRSLDYKRFEPLVTITREPMVLQLIPSNLGNVLVRPASIVQKKFL